MKTKFLQTVFILCMALLTKAQTLNLVPNGDFELGPDSSSAGWVYGPPFDTTGGNCSVYNPLPGPDFWSIVAGSPDRIVTTGPPDCNWDNSTAYSGKAYIVVGAGANNYLEAGKTTLIIPLKKDSLYHLHCCVSLQTFLGNPYTYSPAQIAIVFNNSGDSILSPLIWTTTWQCFDTIFSAKANSTEIIVYAVCPIPLSFGGVAANVDNIILQKVSPSSISSINYKNENVIIYPNPADYSVNIKIDGKIKNIEIKDEYGNTLLQSEYAPVDVSELSDGNYIILIHTDKKIIAKRFFIMRKKSFN